jgi:hypothetical protein
MAASEEKSFDWLRSLPERLGAGRMRMLVECAVNITSPPPGVFSDVRILKDLQEAIFASADSKGVTGALFVSADSKEVTGENAGKSKARSGVLGADKGVSAREDGRKHQGHGREYGVSRVIGKRSTDWSEYLLKSV